MKCTIKARISLATLISVYGSSVQAQNMEERCLKHTPRICFEVGNEEEAKGQKERAKAYFLRSCLNKYGASCNRLGYYEELDHQIRRSYHYYLMACDLDSDRGCANLSRVANKIGKYDLSEAARKKACGLGHKTSCKKVQSKPDEYYCPPHQSKPCHEYDKKYSERWQDVKTQITEEKQKEQAQIIATIDEQPAAKILEIDRKKLEELPPEKIAEKLDESTVATLDEKQIEKVPPKAIEEKAWNTSFFDSFKPGMDKLFSKLSFETAGGYLSLRYGFSLTSSRVSPLLSKMRTFGLLYEKRAGIGKGVKILVESAKRQSAVENNATQSLGWQKILAAYAWEYRPSALVDAVHVMPRIGKYDVYTKLITEFNSDGSPITGEFDRRNAVSAGIEGDVEFGSFFYIFRFWGGKDFGVNLGISKDKTQITSTRMGLDAILKAGRISALGVPLSMNYMVFAASESLKFENKQKENSKLELSIPFAGLGLSASW